jgi:PEP-CTERM motif
MTMKLFQTLSIATLLLLALAARANADDISLTLDPASGALTGPAGSTVGWGFTLSNSGSGFAVISGSDFCVGPITSPCGTSFGSYTDFIGQQFIVVGSSSVTETFDNNTQFGLGSFFINPASTGTVTGLAVVFYDLFSVDPNSPDFNPDLDTISNGNLLTADASVTVGSSTTSTPEPGSLLLLTAGALAFISFRRFRVASNPPFPSAS